MNKKGNALGRSLIRDYKKKHVISKDGFRHTSDLPDGFDWARLNLRSVTEQSSIDDFLSKVQLVESEYNKEFSNVEILSTDSVQGVLTESERELVSEAQEKHKHILSIPRRPLWDSTTTKEELDAKEREEFLNWRRKLAFLQEENHITLTPYEKNLEIWRQLWRVVEKSDVIVQIVDARNPLLFRCEDLEMYVKEIDDKKVNILLLNKADFLSQEQRDMWAEYLNKIGVQAIFFSAKYAMAKTEVKDDNCIKEDKLDHSQSDTTEDSDVEETSNSSSCDKESNLSQCENNLRHTTILSSEDLILYFKQFQDADNQSKYVTTIGLVGYPNVGKSSTINAILSVKKVQVSATPGKTKHFQTLMVTPSLCLCDCPGLVFPNFVSTKADMIINGILPIDNLTSHAAPVTLVTNLIPRDTLSSTYSIMLPPPAEGMGPLTPPTAEEFLNAYGYMRGFMTPRGIPDNARSSRYILKDFVNGKLLYCYPPPNVDNDIYEKFTNESVTEKLCSNTKLFKNTKLSMKLSDEIDKKFFSKGTKDAHMKGVKNITGYTRPLSSTSGTSQESKPWKKHHNRNRKEKLRRIYSASDQ